MSYVLTVSPDFPPSHISGWYIFNTWLQQACDIPIHLEICSYFEDQHKAINEDSIDLIYANPFDASILVREKNFKAIVIGRGTSDEAVVVSAKDKGIDSIEALSAGTRIAKSANDDINLMGMMLIEPANLSAENTQTITVNSFPLVAKQLLQNNADIGFFLDSAYDELSNLVKLDLQELIRSKINIIQHVFLASPRLAEHHDKIKEALITMNESEKGRKVLQSLGIIAWENQDHEDTEFMIDLMDTLVIS